MSYGGAGGDVPYNVKEGLTSRILMPAYHNDNAEYQIFRMNYTMKLVPLQPSQNIVIVVDRFRN